MPIRPSGTRPAAGRFQASQKEFPARQGLATDCIGGN